jgi:hypothetical protein
MAAVCVEPDAGLMVDVFCTGLYKARDPKVHADDVMPYTPGLKFWSDGAQKDHFLYLPPNTQIDTSQLDAWKFPVGTKAWKEFRIEGKLNETRLFWKVLRRINATPLEVSALSISPFRRNRAWRAPSGP